LLLVQTSQLISQLEQQLLSKCGIVSPLWRVVVSIYSRLYDIIFDVTRFHDWDRPSRSHVRMMCSCQFCLWDWQPGICGVNMWKDSEVKTATMMKMVEVRRGRGGLICGCGPTIVKTRDGDGAVLATWLKHSSTTERSSLNSVCISQ